MTQRIDYQKVSSGAFRAMLGMENYVRQCGLVYSLIELVKTRASQINGAVRTASTCTPRMPAPPAKPSSGFTA